MDDQLETQFGLCTQHLAEHFGQHTFRYLYFLLPEAELIEHGFITDNRQLPLFLLIGEQDDAHVFCSHDFRNILQLELYFVHHACSFLLGRKIRANDTPTTNA